MSEKIERETRLISGKSIEWMQGHDGWISGRLDTGESISISLKILFKLFNDYEFRMKRHGNIFRATGEFYLSEELDAPEELKQN